MGMQKESSDLQSDLAWLLHPEPTDHPHPFLLDLSRAIGVVVVISLLFHLAKNL